MKKLTVSINRKADHTVAGEFLMTIRGAIQEEELTLEQRIELLKAGNNYLRTRVDIRSESRKNALAQIQVDEHNERFNKRIEIVNVELADIEPPKQP